MFLARRMAARRRPLRGRYYGGRFVALVSEDELRRMTAFPTRAALLGCTAGLPIQWFCFGVILSHPKSHFATMWAAAVFGTLHLATLGGWIYYAMRRRKMAA